MTAIWTLGEQVEFENGWLAEVVHVAGPDPHFAILRKQMVSGRHAYEAAHREAPVDPAEPAGDTWIDPLEGQRFHTVDAAMAALASHLLNSAAPEGTTP